MALDTSSRCGSIALYSNDRITFISYLDIQLTHSERLLPQIDFGLQQSSLIPADLDLICLSNGPGSFTGTRIGLATAKGICMGNEIPLQPYNTLAVLAHNVFLPALPVLVMMDARMNEVYAALYAQDYKELIPPGNYNPEDILSLVKETCLIIGDGYRRFTTEISRSGIKYIPVPENLNVPLAATMIGMFLQSDEKPDYDFNFISQLEPYYFRKSQAELVKERRS